MRLHPQIQQRQNNDHNKEKQGNRIFILEIFVQLKMLEHKRELARKVNEASSSLYSVLLIEWPWPQCWSPEIISLDPFLTLWRVKIHLFFFFFFFLQVDSAEFIHCKETVDEYLHSLEFSLPANAIYIFDSAQIPEDERAWSPTQPLRQPARGRGSGGEQGSSDEYYDGFLRLYDQESNPGSEQKNMSPCPPLHPAVN